ncbi:hypothetical protein MIND_00785900 [Mycena indigotica]|uniref:Uncharacterized protein n=1 Tax=Mycena indigotica TaxID=2126181 RepID=A0A8H6SNN3_9AGAR|nr:uncharacterized protein MIND_00785900 [Mycena indigotica]KAF7302190.1 hypothetical protein MIND_00785900 [Mycena indigotica]
MYTTLTQALRHWSGGFAFADLVFEASIGPHLDKIPDQPWTPRDAPCALQGWRPALQSRHRLPKLVHFEAPISAAEHILSVLPATLERLLLIAYPLNDSRFFKRLIIPASALLHVLSRVEFPGLRSLERSMLIFLAPATLMLPLHAEATTKLHRLTSID